MTTQNHTTPEDPETRERAEFQVGGQDRDLTPEQQLEQLGSYIDAHYPLPSLAPPWAGGDGDPDPADLWTGKLPDRITHAAMLQLGSGLDHSMPGVAYGQDVTTEDVPELGGTLFIPSEPTGRWAVSLHSGGWWRGSGDALEFQWRPEVAAAAALSGTIIVDLDYPLAPAHPVPTMIDAVERAISYARTHNADSVTVWGYSSGGALAALASHRADALVLTFPDLGSVAKLPDDVRGSAKLPTPKEWPRSLVQIALFDEIADRPDGLTEVTGIEVREYVARHRISTPEVAREKVRDVAAFLRSVPTV